MTHPHDPYVVPETYWSRYRDDEIDMPRVGDLAGREDPHSTRLRHVIGLGLDKPTEAQVRAARRAYYGAVSYVDDQIGILMNTLKEARFADNTIVMVLADHGDMLGERGLWYKMNFFEPACTIPLIVHAPGRFAPHRVAESASLLDVLPTLAEIANGGTAPEYAAPIGGRSLLPALQGTAAGPGEVIGEYLAEGAVAPVVMIRRRRYKFIHSPVDPDQLYDLANDPDERVNLATKADYAPQTREFRTEIANRWQLQNLHEAVIANQRQRHFVYPALRAGRFQPWDFQPLRDASRLYIRNDQELNDLETMARFPRLD
jgi:choline-sulfatase